MRKDMKKNKVGGYIRKVREDGVGRERIDVGKEVEGTKGRIGISEKEERKY